MQYFFEEDYFRTYGRDFDASFNDYRHAEKRLHYPGAQVDSLDVLPGSQPANPDFQLVDMIHQATRHQAPEVKIDNMAHDDKTRIDVIAGNRPGSLLEIVMVLTELGCDILHAFIVSDNKSWIIDNFWVVDPTSPSKKLVDQRKIDILLEVMSLDPSSDLTAMNTPQTDMGHTILELTGRDRPGLLADVTALLNNHSYVLRSLAVWTHNNCAAFVLSVGDARERHRRNAAEEVGRLYDTLRRTMGAGNATIAITKVAGPIHHDRRLHKLLFAVEAAAWKVLPREPSRGKYYDTEEPAELVNGQPWIGITEEPTFNNWEIHIKCKDRLKLMFDVCCALADLDLSVLGGTIRPARSIPPQPGQTKGYDMAEHYFYVLPRSGSQELADMDERAMYIHDMLTAALCRRHPPSALKVHLSGSSERLALVAGRFKQAGLTVTRARVRPFDVEATHTLYLQGQEGAPPTEAQLAEVFNDLGGTKSATQHHLCGSGDSPSMEAAPSLTYSLRTRIDQGWSGGPASASASPPSTLLHEASGSLPIHSRHFR